MDEELAESKRQTEEQRKRFAREAEERRKKLDMELAESRRESEENKKKLDREFAESRKKADKEFEKLDRQIQKVGGSFNERWGHFMESLVEGCFIRIISERGINVTEVMSNFKKGIRLKDGRFQEREFDLVAVNGKELVVTEVKNVLTKKDVEEFISDWLKNFKSYFPSYKDKQMYGAVAFLREKKGAANWAEEQGLFIIKATGDSAHIINKESFKPKIFS